MAVAIGEDFFFIGVEICATNGSEVVGGVSIRMNVLLLPQEEEHV